MKKLLLSIGLLLTLTVHSLSAKAATSTEFSEAQLAQMLAPIALYPDSLLTHILIASTYPIEVVEADRWISKQSNVSSNKISKSIEDKSWEPSVKALVMFPEVLERLSDDLSWTQQLGDAFLQSEEDVLAAIQNLRYEAEKAGSLKKMKNVEVTRENKNIIIQPTQKEVVYVPYYDTRHVYGDWRWAMNPPIFWNWGHHINLSRLNPFRWHSGVHISLNYFFSAFHWNNRHVVVVDHRNTRRYSNKKHIVRSGYANRWVHKPQHRRGVTYRNEHLNKRFKSHRPVVRKTITKQHNGYVKAKRIDNNRHGVSTHKVSKHDALQRKFKERATVNKPRTMNKALSHKNTKVVKTTRKEVAQKKSFNSKPSNKQAVNNKVQNRVQHRTEKPVFKEQKKVERKSTYTQSKRSNDQYKKSSRSQTVRNKPVRKSHSSNRRSEKRQEHK